MKKRSSLRPRWPAIALAGAFILILAGAGTGRPVSAAEPRDLVLFTSAGTERIGGLEVKGALRQRTVAINPALGQSNGVGLGDRLWITPFADRSYLAVVDRIEMDINGVLAVRGRVEGLNYGYVLLSSRGGHTMGSLSMPEQGLEFDVLPVADTAEHLVLEVDTRNRDILEEAPPLEPPAEESDDLLGPQSPAASSALAAEARLDIMIVYTPAARDWAASRGGIDLIINQDIQNGVLSLQNSGLNVTQRLVHSALIDYQEDGDSGVDLQRLKNTADEFMDDIHRWRDSHSADLVQLLALVSDVGGIGYLLSNTRGNPAYAFTLVRVQQAGWTYTSIHEIGHNLGCHHRKDQAVQPGPGIFPYSAGWRWIGSNGLRYCSIMSYQEEWEGNIVIRVPYFSSPLFTYMGAAVGDALDADNARTISRTGPIVGAYRKKQNQMR